ncbi:MAG: imidazolonepropionase [Bacteroidetes bacterium]|nr:imidazolonepropionase [Bacteroidota bacterium]MBS1629240.1 imidazolonepropionase [Bacteroidota bacterium]
MRSLITNIHLLAGIENGDRRRVVSGADMASMRCLKDAWVLAEGGLITGFGTMDALPDFHADTQIDASGSIVLPAWCDSHTHIVFAAARDGEFVDRIRGLSYAEIAARGGGILNSANKLNEADEEALFDAALHRVHQVMAQGTGALEIKSGYGLNTESELKMLRVIRRLRETLPIPIRASFLAAHAYPASYRNNKEAYVKLIIDEMLPRVADEGLADYMDVFCEEGFFSVDDTSRLLDAAALRGLKPKIHANQLHNSGGVQVGIRHGAISVDHLECVAEPELEALKHSDTIPTLLPGAAYFLGMHYQPARQMIDAGLPVCLATDYNPGSCPSGNVPLLLNIACTQMKMLPEEAIQAVTLNGAAAIELSTQLGTIAVGKTANLIITRPMPSLAYIPYDFGNNPVGRMMIKGRI